MASSTNKEPHLAVGLTTNDFMAKKKSVAKKASKKAAGGDLLAMSERLKAIRSGQGRRSDIESFRTGQAEALEEDRRALNAGSAEEDKESLIRETKFIWVPDLLWQYQLGMPGYALGRMGFVGGLEGVGKTSRLLTIARLFYEAGGIVFYLENEHAMSQVQIDAYMGPFAEDFSNNVIHVSDWESFRVRLDKLFNDTFPRIDPDNDIPKLVAFETLASLADTAADGDDLAGADGIQYGGSGRQSADLMPKLVKKVSNTNTLFFWGNHGKNRIPATSEAKIWNTTAWHDKLSFRGGDAPRFYSSYSEYLKAGPRVKDPKTGAIIGRECTVYWKKNKLGVPDREMRQRTIYGRPFDFEEATLKWLASANTLGMDKVSRGNLGVWYLCPGIGIDEPIPPDEMYALIHSREHVFKFHEELGIGYGYDIPMENIYFPLDWYAQEDPEPVEEQPLEDETPTPEPNS